MFNRNNIPNPLGRASTSNNYVPPEAHASTPGYGGAPPPRNSSSRKPAPNRSVIQLRPARSPNDGYTFGNICAVSPLDVPPSRSDTYLLVNGRYVFSARPMEGFPQGQMSLSDPQRSWAQIAMTDILDVQMYDPFAEGGHTYLASLDLELGFAGRKETETPYDQDEMAQYFIKSFQNQILAPGQQILIDHKNIKLRALVRTVGLGDLSMEKPSSSAPSSDLSARGILVPQTAINFFKAPNQRINIKPSSKRPAANAIVSLDFKFEDMGIGGLDAEFNIIFRRAFASRIFPPGLIEKMGLQHVRGILLHGPPGTGKTLIARQIGKMLNAREPKVINGPEVLNKFVGQSEENVRKIFADAEKEYKEKGDESGLHIIIFDELDAVCKQRGSGAAGGTGVGDSVVNQLLSKLDGVDQLNNILLIGMTNRKDMLDDALLRPGRLEVHVEISLPDAHGRQQILNIHTQKMRDNRLLAPDVDLAELASMTKNFSGAEINGLVRAAQSFAFARHTKVGTMAGVSDDVDQLKVTRADFISGLQDVQPAFGVSEEELTDRYKNGITPYSLAVQSILDEGSLYVRQVRNSATTRVFSVLFHGPPGSGKTALAAKIAMLSDFPFIKLVSPRDIAGFSETMKINHLLKVFDDAYKSPLNVIVIDDIEKLIDWQPIGPRFQNSVLATLNVLLDKEPPKGRRLLILATTTQRSVMQQLDIFNAFSADIAVPNVNTSDELGYVLQATGAFQDAEIRNAIAKIQEQTGDNEIGIGIKRILNHVEGAKQDEDLVGRFAELMGKAIATRKYI